MSTLMIIVGIISLAVVLVTAIEHFWPTEPLDEIAVIDNELRRLHSEASDYSIVPTWITNEINKLNDALIKIKLESDRQFHEQELKEINSGN